MSQKASAKVVLFIGIKNYFKENCEKSCGITKIILPLHPQSSKHGAIAQMVEQRTENPCVPGSIPGGTTPPFIMPQYFRVERHFLCPKVLIQQKVIHTLLPLILCISGVKSVDNYVYNCG